jgi:N-acetylglucosamine kinase-like BadF-type ATPase
LNAIGVDIGGTKIAAGVVTPEGEVLNEVRYPTAASPERLLPAREEVHLRARSPSRDLVEIKKATLGPKSGVLAAAVLARDPSDGYLLGP